MPQSCSVSVIARQKDCGGAIASWAAKGSSMATWSGVESSQAMEGASAGVEFNPQEVFGFRGGEVRSDLGRRTLSRRRRYRRGPRNAATVDAGRRIVESEAEAQEAFETTGAQSPFWRDGAAGWQLP